MSKDWTQEKAFEALESEVTTLRAENERLREAGVTMSRAADRHFESARQLHARVKELEAALRGLVDFTDYVPEAQRLDVWHMRLAKARSALSPAPPAPSPWRPIETAPKDGTLLLATNGKWRGTTKYHEPLYEGDPPWVDEYTEFIEPPVTHWMPLPPLPRSVAMDALTEADGRLLDE